MKIKIGKASVARLAIVILSLISIRFINGVYKNEILLSLVALSVFLIIFTLLLEEEKKKASLKFCIITGLISALCVTYATSQIIRSDALNNKLIKTALQP